MVFEYAILLVAVERRICRTATLICECLSGLLRKQKHRTMNLCRPRENGLKIYSHVVCI